MKISFFLPRVKRLWLGFWGLLTSEVWIFLALTVLSVFLLFKFVNLQPEVSDNFFFSSDDPQFQSEHKISELFLRNDQQIIISATGAIETPEYTDKIYKLTEAFLHLPGITGVKSLTHGPNDFEDALESPLWKRLLISDDKQSTNLILFAQDPPPDNLILLIEKITETFSEQGFELKVSGMPYIVELIRRSLLRDLRVFSTLALAIFGIIIFSIFRSKSVLIGTLVSCLNACVLTFIVSDLLNIPIGILTANLGTIICILTLSHIIFLSFNWKHLCSTRTISPVADAMQITFSPSFWSMLTTLLGFISLLSVEAKPLRDLGASGAIGTIMAIAVSYTIFPAFLKMGRRSKQIFWERHKNASEKAQLVTYRFLERKNTHIIAILITIGILAVPGLRMIDADPSLLSYFSKKSNIRQGLDYIDRNGGSSPLLVVVRPESGDSLISKQSYEDMWSLQEKLEQHRSVGSVISLPILLAQAKKAPLAFLLSWNQLISALEKPEHDAIARCFISKDRNYGLFMLRMTEGFRTLPRLDIVNEIDELVRGQKFVPELMGGIYVLQGHLAKLVSISLVWGLGKLIVLFAVIGFIVSRSFKITSALTLSIVLLPITILGLIGLYRIPLDVISAPASNIAIAIGIDSMIHLIKAYRRLGSWQNAKEILWQPILTAMFVISIGFSIFMASSFPPTQRFGFAIVVGTIIAGLTALFIMPFLANKISLDKIPRTIAHIPLPHITPPKIEFSRSKKAEKIEK